MTAPTYKRKDTRPSERMLPSDGGRYRCRWLEDSITVHSDGNVSCGLDDPHANRSFGNVRVDAVEAIVANPERERLRQGLAEGRRCHDCSLYEAREGDAPIVVPALPSTLVVEPTITCNLRCPNLACVPNNGAKGLTRDGDKLDYGVFERLIDQLAEGLRQVYFFNYGDPFMHRRAEDMLGYLRARCPEAQVVTSTNGIPLARGDRAAKVVEAGIDHVVFTISGVTQASYERYHANGRLDLALQGLEAMCAAKRRLGADRPRIVWRYLAFRWNDGEAEIAEAIRLSERYGVDQFSLYLTHLPDEAASFRLSPGSPGHRRFARYVTAAHGYNCEVPDAEGFFGVEEIAGLGRVRWTSARARLHLPVAGGAIRAGLGTINVGPARGDRWARVTVPWGTYRVRLEADRWTDLALRVPKRFRGSGPIALTIEAEDPVYPAEHGTADLRCLGALVRVDDRRSAAARAAASLVALCRGLRRGASVLRQPTEAGRGDAGGAPQIAGLGRGGRFVGFAEG